LPPDRSERPKEGRVRAQIEGLTPRVDGGRFPVKRIVGDELVVEADVFGDGHDRVAAAVLHRRAGRGPWRETPMEPLGNDRWRAAFPLEKMGRYQYTVLAWVDPFLTWMRDFEKWVAAGLGDEVAVELQVGARLVAEGAARAREAPRRSRAAGSAEELEGWAENLHGWSKDAAIRNDPSPLAGPRGPLAGGLSGLMARVPDRQFAHRHPVELEVVVDRERARFSAWYEFFPRSTSPEPGRHGTFEDARGMLGYVREMGFDVVYLPPIHPVGRTNRKGANNNPTAQPGEPGSPWAIGSEEGGHTAVHPELGTLEDFRAFRQAAEDEGLEVALDVAFQCSPDHPWVRDHPEWFRHLPDGSIRYAENPPKKYQDIYPLDFETKDWAGLWDELREVFRFWADEGVRIFRVDNPHTKALPFWEWAIEGLKAEHPDLIFLSEAFTRPRMMYRLAKLGFTQSYTYFAWRNTKWELTSYMEELAHGEVREYFRPNFWPNTPDILTEALQSGKRPAFMARLVLAATLSSSYGIYGPAFELMEHRPREEGSEEYLDSEKYELRHWDLGRADSLKPFIARVNRIRKESPALHRNETIRFHAVDNDRILAYTKQDPAGDSRILTVVSLDPDHRQSGWLELDLGALGMDEEAAYLADDRLGGGRYLWQGRRNYVELDPTATPAHIFRLTSRPGAAGRTAPP
jgi:starch synthase (maltosyl-transferring)